MIHINNNNNKNNNNIKTTKNNIYNRNSYFNKALSHKKI